MDLSSLNDQQLKAVMHGAGPCCVLAGAGSGKTRVLTYRIARLIEDGVKPGNILAVTFTRKAAGEMVERLEQMLGKGAVEDLNIGTFHSICYRIVRDEFRALGIRTPDVADERWQKKTIKAILAPWSEKNPYGMDWDLDISFALAWISYQKNNLIGPDGDLIAVRQEFMLPKFRRLYRSYEEIKSMENKLDFDDMLLWTYQLLRDNPAIRRKYQQQFTWILVDEFQDTNLAQYEILKLVAPPENNLFVVGDDYQSIYGWRSARIDFILDFEQDWPGAVTIPLEINYRSTKNIVDASNRLIAHNLRQYKKDCYANRDGAVEPIVRIADDETAEAEMIAQEIKTLCDQDQSEYGYGDIAILYRINAQSAALEDVLVRANIPYVIVGALGFYDRKEVKDIIAYLKAALGDEESARRIVNIPNRYLGQVFVQAVESYAIQHKIPFLQAVCECPEADQKRYRKGVQDLLDIILWLKKGIDETPPAALIAELRKRLRYDEWLIKEEGGDEGPDNPRIENLNSLVQAASRFQTVREFLAYVDSIAARNREEEENGCGKVQLMTLHKAKGLEFPVVFLAGVSEGLLPHKRAIQYRHGENGETQEIPESLEEERRLCYVGMTRAKDLLYMFSALNYNGRPLEPSRFLREI